MPRTNLQIAIKKGIIWIKDGIYLGQASDGVVVRIGRDGEESDIEDYLRISPDPSDW